MVTKSEETELNRLESQVDNGGGGAWEYLCLVRKLKVRRSDKVLKHGLSILNDSKKRSSLGSEEWTLYEEVAIAAMDCQSLEVAKDCVNVLRKKFPESKRVGILGRAEKAYSSLLEDNPFDQVVHKRRVALAKAQGNLSGAIEWLNKYLETFMADHDAWRELAEIYVSLQMYKQAAFCYEELILSQPTVPLFHLAYADVSNLFILVISSPPTVPIYHLAFVQECFNTLGGLENLQTARKYYSSTIDLTGGKNTRALFGICLCMSAIAQLSKGRNKEDKDCPDLQSLATAALEKEYKQRASGKLTVLTSAFKSLKFHRPGKLQGFYPLLPNLDFIHFLFPSHFAAFIVSIAQFYRARDSTSIPRLSWMPNLWNVAAVITANLLILANSIWKNKRISKGKKGGKKKAHHLASLSKIFGRTLVTRTQGTKKIRLRAEDVQGRNVLNKLYGEWSLHN
ncbi:hypothetical protein NC652_013033 [Populus alba x Populus x berolinensis]|nr:hypothetical protein NC652_013033 [Populus alba x Populus x berolinensis]